MTDLRRRVAEALGVEFYELSAGGYYWGCPHYDTDLDAITAAIEAAGYGYRVYADTQPIKVWVVPRNAELPLFEVQIATADTAPAALCQALLLALGEKAR